MIVGLKINKGVGRAGMSMKRMNRGGGTNQRKTRGSERTHEQGVGTNQRTNKMHQFL